jgi:hypothetical protein
MYVLALHTVFPPLLSAIFECDVSRKVIANDLPKWCNINTDAPIKLALVKQVTSRQYRNFCKQDFLESRNDGSILLIHKREEVNA